MATGKTAVNCKMACCATRRKIEHLTNRLTQAKISLIPEYTHNLTDEERIFRAMKFLDPSGSYARHRDGKGKPRSIF